MKENIIKKINNSPELPGVYLFYHKKEVIYIGKANNLKIRLKSYFKTNSNKNRFIQKEATDIRFKITLNDIEALLLEAKLIKQQQPKFNVIFKDNKNYFYVRITSELFPKILITHNFNFPGDNIIGPFTSGKSLKELLKTLRWSFPYCVCKTYHKKQCLDSQLGLCPGACCLKNIEYDQTLTKNYQENIKSIIKILMFKNDLLKKELKEKIQKAINKEDFETANIIKKQIISLENIFKHQPLIGTNKKIDYSETEKFFKKILGKKIKTVEMYDVSNISGQWAVASLVFFENGLPDKKNYKKFKIKYTKLLPNDIAMLKEVFLRRQTNINWPTPELILIDGGIGQLNIAQKVFHGNKKFKNIAIGSLAKGKKQMLLFKNGKVCYFNIDTLPLPTQHFLNYIQSESHRFAIDYHHKLYLSNLK